MLSGKQPASTSSVIPINPESLTPDTTPLLAALFRNNPTVNLLDAIDFATGQPRIYTVLIPDPVSPGNTVVQQVSLTNSLVRYARKKNQEDHRYAVCNARILAKGLDGKIYFSDATIKLENQREHDLAIIFKKKEVPGKRRVVKRFTPKYDEKGEPVNKPGDPSCDVRTSHDKALHEYSFLSTLTTGVKQPVLMDDINHAALVMHRVEGRALQYYLAEDCGRMDDQHRLIRGTGNIFSVLQRLDMMIMLGEAILFLHDAGIIHRDIKPQNIIVEIDERNNLRVAVVIDFGASNWKHEKDAFNIFYSGGTKNFRSPEQARGEMTDEKTDVYSYAKIGKLLLQYAVHASDDIVPLQIKAKLSDLLKRGAEKNCVARANMREMINRFKVIKAQYIVYRDHELNNQSPCIIL